MDEQKEIIRRLALALRAADTEQAVLGFRLTDDDYAQHMLMKHLDAHGLEISLRDGELAP